MQWILDIPANELVIDAAAVSGRLNASLARGRVLTGAGLVNDRLLLILETGDPGNNRYRIAPFDGFSPDDAAAEIRFRYTASFTTAAVFEYSGRIWGIFCTCQPTRK